MVSISIKINLWVNTIHLIINQNLIKFLSFQISSGFDAIGFKLFTEMEENDIESWKDTFFNINRTSSEESIIYATEIITAQLFTLLTGNLKKFDHNLFITTAKYNSSFHGPFNYIDNDRAQWDISPAYNRKFYPLNPYKEICKFPERIAHRILLLRPGNKRKITLGSYLFNITKTLFRPNMKNGKLFTSTQAQILDTNVRFIAEMIDSCLAKHPRESVFIPEYWKQPQIYDNIEELFDAIF